MGRCVRRPHARLAMDAPTPIRALRGLKRLGRRLLRLPQPPPAHPWSDEEHPERLAVLPYCVGRGIEVGCGHRKTAPNCIGVDLLASGEKGTAGVVAGRASVADVQASGDHLPMFEDGSLDFVVARHNLEHYVDVVKTLQEWRRVLRQGGHLAVVLPDESALDTIALDPTHKHAFTPDSFRRLVRLLGGLEEVECRPVIAGWSFLFAARRGGPDGARD